MFEYITYKDKQGNDKIFEYIEKLGEQAERNLKDWKERNDNNG